MTDPEIAIPDSAGPTAAHRTALAHAVASATDPLEAAVTLESVGINDRVARERFTAPDVFALAGRSYEQACREGEGEPGGRPRSLPVIVAEPGDRERSPWWFALRGLLYALPAIVVFALLPAADVVESALLLGGLILGWSWGYGMTARAWAYLGNLDDGGARRSLRVAIMAGLVVTAVGAVVSVLQALLTTESMQISQVTVLMLVGQTGYLLAAGALLLMRTELLLLAALAPAILGTFAALPRRADPGGAAALMPPGRGVELAWLGATVVLALVLAMVATHGARRPRQRLHRRVWGTVAIQTCYGLLAALLVLFPALAELINPNYESLPLSVTVAALPLVLGMGLAELLVHRFRRRVRDLLATTASARDFARRVRVRAFADQLLLAVALAVLTAAVAALASWIFGPVDRQYWLLGLAYVLLGTALFGAMLLNLMGWGLAVLAALGCGALVLGLLLWQADPSVSDAVALSWLATVAIGLALVLSAAALWVAGRPVSHR